MRKMNSDNIKVIKMNKYLQIECNVFLTVGKIHNELYQIRITKLQAINLIKNMDANDFDSKMIVYKTQHADVKLAVISQES